VSDKPIKVVEGRIAKAEGVDRRRELSRLHPSQCWHQDLSGCSRQWVT
jgi:hypothetical protein